MKSFEEFLDEQQLDESWVVDALGHMYMGLVGAVTGAATGAVKGAGKGAWLGLTTGDPFHEVIKFKSAMKKFNNILKQMPPGEVENVKRQFCSIIQRM